MKLTSSQSKIFPGILLFFGFGFFLASCGGGNQAALKANAPVTITAQHNIPDNDIDIAFNPVITMAPDGGVTIFRVSETKKMVIEHYSQDTLGLEWSVPLNREKEDSWYPHLQYKNGLLNCLGSNVFSDGDSIGIRMLIIDPKTHSIQKESWSGKSVSSIPLSWDPLPTLSRYASEISPDSNYVLFYRTDNRGRSDMEKSKEIKMHCELYQSDGTSKKAFDISISSPDPKLSRAELAIIHRAMKVDNEGNVYHLKLQQPGTLEVTKYPFADPAASVTLSASFKNCDFKSDMKIGIPLVSFDPLSNVMSVTAAREKLQSGLGKEELYVMYEGYMRGLIHATFDFASNQAHSFQYDPSPDVLDTLIDQKNLTFYAIVRQTEDKEKGKTHIFLEKREKGMTTTTFTQGGGFATNWTSYRVSHPFNYCYGLLLLSFDNTGKLLWQTPLPKEQDNVMDYFFRQANSSAFTIYLVDRDAKIQGLQKCSLDLSTGTLSPAQNVLQFESDTYILTNFTLWQNAQTALMFAAGSTTFGGQLRLRNPLVFKLATQ